MNITLLRPGDSHVVKLRTRQPPWRPATFSREETAVFGVLGMAAIAAVWLAVFTSPPAAETKASRPAHQEQPVVRISPERLVL